MQSLIRFAHRVQLFAEIVFRTDLTGIGRLGIRTSWTVACIVYD